MSDQLNNAYDAIVIGGGAAGLNGALMLARARRSVAVIDAGTPRNSPAAGIHGLLGREGMSPAEFLDRGRAEVRGYGGHIATGTVATVRPATPEIGAPAGDPVQDNDDDPRFGFTVILTDGGEIRARRLLVASGVVDTLPDIPGLWDRWGHDVLHCPYCHGWEVRDRAIGVLATGPMSVHQALLFRQWSSDVVYFPDSATPPTDEQAEQLAARGIDLAPADVAAVEADADRLTGVRLTDGTRVDRDAVAVAPTMAARVDYLADLGLQPTQHPSGVGAHIVTDPAGRTDVPGVWAAGNVTDLMGQVGAAAAAGAAAGAQINADLVAEETTRAVAHRRASTPAA